MNQTISIRSKENISIALLSIKENDLEDLRNWKNANKNNFFHSTEITIQQQKKWCEEFLLRPDDYMFIVYVNETKIGCMGFRKTDSNDIDIYNIILGNETYGKKGYMSIALKTMCNYAFSISHSEITVKVLKTNPASDWYKKINFVEISPQIDYFYFKLNYKDFEEYSFEITT